MGLRTFLKEKRLEERSLVYRIVTFLYRLFGCNNVNVCKGNFINVEGCLMKNSHIDIEGTGNQVYLKWGGEY